MCDEELREAQLMLDAIVAFRGAMSSDMRKEIMKRFCELTGLKYHDAPAVLSKRPEIDEVIKSELEVFLDARCETGAKAKCRCRELYDAFVDWCLARDVQPPSINRMSAVLRQIRPFTTYKSDSEYKWCGVTLKKEEKK